MLLNVLTMDENVILRLFLLFNGFKFSLCQFHLWNHKLSPFYFCLLSIFAVFDLHASFCETDHVIKPSKHSNFSLKWQKIKDWAKRHCFFASFHEKKLLIRFSSNNRMSFTQCSYKHRYRACKVHKHSTISCQRSVYNCLYVSFLNTTKIKETKKSKLYKINL